MSKFNPRFLIVSLGNPLPEYSSLHSAGHFALQGLPKVLRQPSLQSSKIGKLSCLVSHGSKYTLIQSPTFMNVSGPFVVSAWKEMLKQHDAASLSLVVLHDELEKTLGQAALVAWDRSPRGHNGIKSVKKALREDKYPQSPLVRIAVGIDRPQARDPDTVASEACCERIGRCPRTHRAKSTASDERHRPPPQQIRDFSPFCSGEPLGSQEISSTPITAVISHLDHDWKGGVRLLKGAGRRSVAIGPLKLILCVAPDGRWQLNEMFNASSADARSKHGRNATLRCRSKAAVLYWTWFYLCSVKRFVYQQVCASPALSSLPLIHLPKPPDNQHFDKKLNTHNFALPAKDTGPVLDLQPMNLSLSIRHAHIQ
ncbi:hypothetical protein LMH87_009301 [Akanthomyces muscarius]|uniref:peptidyl-tRNA hydrolase n=1 Tax=Akanthomyces muscarius TaxID=2231603 RepID=A0A9W8QDM7_AKAMU|nr:hypothetical protein LMH87_009301 [Akanthomyces muscarius]KAJ4152781.1 hypothetical protein LMH87_009301 [Akanthomyces muscarius]